VYVRCSRTQSTQADVRSAVPRTAPMMRNLISAGRANEASSREYAPQRHDRPAHLCKCLSADGDFGGLLSHTLWARRRWDEDGLYATRLRSVRVFSRNKKQPPLLVYIQAQREVNGQQRLPLELPLQSARN
jgi:hypothetical protein